MINKTLVEVIKEVKNNLIMILIRFETYIHMTTAENQLKIRS